MEKLAEAMRARVDGGSLPGLVMAVADRDTVRVEAIGRTAFEQPAAGGSAAGEPAAGGTSDGMRRDTPFRITSVTKPMVGAVAMTFVDEGLLDPAESVDRLLPELASPRVLRRLDGPVDDTVAADRPITVEDLLTSRMGHGLLLTGDDPPQVDPPFPVVLRARELQLRLAEPDPRTPLDVDEWTRRLGTLPLLFQPGTRWAYNTSSLVLGVLVARLGGAPLGDVMRDRLFEPLGMTSTGFSVPAAQAARLPALYMGGERQTVSEPAQWSREPVFPSGAAGLVSTVDDVVAFGRCLLEGGGPVLSAAAVARMTRNHLTPAQIDGGGIFLSGRGWGHNLAVDAGGSYGWDGGYGTRWFNDPATGRVCVLMTQVSDVMWDGTLEEFAALAVT